MSKRVTVLVVTWDDHDDNRTPDGSDWAYYLRMGGIDADDVEAIEVTTEEPHG